MPTRIIREGILTSERVDKLSERAELFYRRLMSVTDDYGRFFAGLPNLIAACYPLRADQPKRICEADVKQMLSECVAADLVRIYRGGKYLQMLDFRQQTRAKSKFPEPTPDELLSKRLAFDSHLLSTVGGGGGVEGGGDKNISAAPPKKEMATAPSARTEIEIYNAMLLRVGALYGRTSAAPLNFHESSALAEICRRRSPEAELDLLEGFQPRDPEYFPKSLESLLRKWDATLDRARTYVAPNHGKPGGKPNPRNEGIAGDPAKRQAAIVETVKRKQQEREQQNERRTESI